MYKWVFSLAIAISCIVEKTIPFNCIRNLNLKIISNKFETGLSFLFNYLVWEILATQAYWLIVDLLVGILTLTFCQQFILGKLTTFLKHGRNIDQLYKYRVVHLLVEEYNKAMHSILLFLFISAGLFQTMSVVTLILLWNFLPFILELIFAFIVLQASVIILFIYGFAGDFNEMSKHSLSRLKKEVDNEQGLSRKERKYWNMFLRSCQIERIKFGMSNFIEKTTPPAFQLFCLCRIIDLLLVR